MDYYKIGQQIRKYRKAHRMSQEQLAEIVGISVTHMSHIETGNTKLSLQVFTNIAKALQISTDNLLSQTPPIRKEQYNELISVMDTCTPQQLQIITDMVKYMKITLDKHQ